MTAYIANALIKGYSRADDLESARRIFESLSDPPYGVAAPGNHVAHDATMVSARTQGDGTDAVYREVSWLAFIVWDELLIVTVSRRPGRRWYVPSSAHKIGTVFPNYCSDYDQGTF